MVVSKAPPPVSHLKSGYKVFSFEPLHVSLKDTVVGYHALLIPVEDFTISQNFNATYNAQQVYGRMDPIATYSNTTRNMRFGFKCSAHHVLDGPQGVVNNIRNINLLTQLLYPAYFETGATINGDPTAVLGAPPFFRIKYGNYVGSFSAGGEFTGESVNGLTGYIGNLGHDLGTIPKNVAFGKQGKDKGYRALPREIKVGFDFTVVHDELVGWYGDKFSPNGYGHNFPYNAGEWKKRKKDNRTTSTPGSKSTVDGSSKVSVTQKNGTMDGPADLEARNNDEFSMHQQLLAVNMEEALELGDVSTSEYGLGMPTYSAFDSRTWQQRALANLGNN